MYQATPYDFPDPSVRYDGAGTYHAYATQGQGITNVQHMTSTDLVTWSAVSECLPTLPAWASTGYTWAPDVFYSAGQYVMYVTVRHTQLNFQCIAVATCATMNGPFVPTSNVGPIVSGAAYNGAIDASGLLDIDGQTAYMTFNMGPGGVGTVYGIRMRCRGLGTHGRPVQLFTADQAWEHSWVEAPKIAHRAAGYVCLYSGYFYDQDGYGIGYCVANDIMGPYTKMSTSAAWFGSNAQLSGPGGQTIFQDAGGNWRIGFHAWPPGQVGYGTGAVRSLWIGGLDLDNMIIS